MRVDNTLDVLSYDVHQVQVTVYVISMKQVHKEQQHDGFIQSPCYQTRVLSAGV